MTPLQAKNLLRNGVFQAFSEGKQIQWTDAANAGQWITYVPNSNGHPALGATEFGTVWRVKPEKNIGYVLFYRTAEDPRNMMTTFIADPAMVQVGYQHPVALVPVRFEEGEGLQLLNKIPE